MISSHLELSPVLYNPPMSSTRNDRRLNVFQPPRIIDPELGIAVQELDNGRRILNMNVGLLGRIEVVDIPARVISPEEKELIERARESYRAMWQGENLIGRVIEDPFDGWHEDNPGYHTRHQIARVVSPDGKEKFVTNRKVAVDRRRQTEVPLYDDIEFWKVVDCGLQESIPFWTVLSSCLQNSGDANDAKPPIHKVAAISRTGIFPYEISARTELDRDQTAAAWALMQIAVTHSDGFKMMVCMLCDEFRDKVLTIKDPGSQNRTKLNFTRSGEILGFGPDRRLELDRSNPDVREHIFKFPGYWMNNEDWRDLLSALVSQRKIDQDDFKSACRDLLESQERVLIDDQVLVLLQQVLNSDELSDEGLERLVHLFSSSRFAKYMIPVINMEGPINSRLSGDELRSRILLEVRDGPRSSILIPPDWAETNHELLLAAKMKYHLT